MQLNISKSELRYSNPFRNANVPNECWFANFALILVAMATSLERSGKKDKIPKLRSNTYCLVKKIVKIDPEDPEIIGLQGIIRNKEN